MNNTSDSTIEESQPIEMATCYLSSNDNIDNFTINLFGDCNDNDIENKYEQLQDFLGKNPEFKKVDYIGVETGYTDRVITSTKRLKIIDPDVVITDYCWNKDLKPYVKNGCSSMLITVNGIRKFGGVCYFKASSPLEIFGHVGSMNEANYCGFLSVDTLYSLKWYKHEGKIIMIGKVDCESG